MELFLPWWSIAIAAFIAGVAIRSSAPFLAGFISIALLWTVKAWFIDSGAPAPLAEKVSAIFQLPNKALLFAVMASLGGLVGGFATLTASLLKRSI